MKEHTEADEAKLEVDCQNLGIGYESELSEDYVEDFKRINDPESFVSFLRKWDYWLDDKIKKLTENDWNTLQPFIADCKNKDFKGPFTERHRSAVSLLLPWRLVRVSLIAQKFIVPWGCAYIQMRRAKAIDY